MKIATITTIIPITMLRLEIDTINYNSYEQSANSQLVNRTNIQHRKDDRIPGNVLILLIALSAFGL
jgi:hypothetical protein